MLKLFYFLKGYVIIDIVGDKGGDFFKLASESGFWVWNVTPSNACCYCRDYSALLELAENVGISLEITRTVSLINFLQRSSGCIFIGAAVLCLFFAVSVGYVWEIEVNGCKDDTKAEVLAILEQQGLTVGVKKSSLPDGNTLRDSIIYNIDDISWAWVYLDGTLARVEVLYAPSHEPIAADAKPCNIVARCDGVIVSVSAFSGRKCVAVGQTVSEGDVLISGAMSGGSLNEPYGVVADGEILAETVITKTCTVPLNKTYTDDTGEEYTKRVFRIFDLEIPLGLKKSPDFEEYRVEKYTPPVGICTYRYIATETVTKPISQEAAVGIATDSLSEQIARSLSDVARKTDEQLQVSQVGEFLKVSLTMHFIENIGMPAPIDAWQMEELTNDKTD